MATEIQNIHKIQDALETIKACAREEINRGKRMVKEGSDDPGFVARYINGWMKIYHGCGVYHGDITDIGFELYPEFFDGVVAEGGGGGR